MSAWHEVIVVGHERSLRAFVAGFAAGRLPHQPVIFAEDVGIGSTTLSDRMRELFAAGSHHLLLVPEDLKTALPDALRERGGEVDLHLEGVARVLSAAMSFTAEVFSEELATRVRRALRESLPPGVTVERSSDSEKRDSDAVGAELYAPEHSYTYTASGRIAGALPGVLEMRRRALELEFVKVEPIALETDRKV